MRSANAARLSSWGAWYPGSRARSQRTKSSQVVTISSRSQHAAVIARSAGRPVVRVVSSVSREAGRPADDLVIQQEYVADLKEQAARAIDTFNVADVFKSVDPTNPWAIFRGYLDGVATQAANAVVPRWIDRLGGADVYTVPNAYQLVESLRIDYGHLGPFGIHP